MTTAIDWAGEGDTCVSLLVLIPLIRIPTVNRGTRDEGDGNERPAAERVAEHLRAAGLEPKLYEKQKNRTNVVARVKGDGGKPPLLLNAHLDVVEADAKLLGRTIPSAPSSATELGPRRD